MSPRAKRPAQGVHNKSWKRRGTIEFLPDQRRAILETAKALVQPPIDRPIDIEAWAAWRDDYRAALAERDRYRAAARDDPAQLCRHLAGDWPFCPWVGCRYHLHVDVGGRGSLTFSAPPDAPWLAEHTCLWTVVRPGQMMTLRAIGQTVGLTRQRVEQILNQALEHLRELIERGATQDDPDHASK